MGKSFATRGDYEVGFKRPPKSTQFKSGQSGNPRGKPKGGKSIEETIHGLLNDVSAANVKGVPTKMPRREILAHKLLEKAYGDQRTAKFVLELDQRVIERRAEQEEQIQDNDAGMARLILYFIQATRTLPAEDFRKVLRSLVSTARPGAVACASALYAIPKTDESDRRAKTFFKTGDTIPDDYDPDKPLPSEPSQAANQLSSGAPDDWPK